MKKSLLALVLSSVLAAGLATANSQTLRIHFDDSGMDYAAANTKNIVSISPPALLNTAYLKLGYQDHVLTVAFFNQPQPDQLLMLPISDIPRWDPPYLDDSLSAAYKKVADIDDVPEISFVRYARSVNHLRIFHHRYGLNALVDIYHNALSDLGFTRVQEAGRFNPRSYVYQNDTGRVALKFHRTAGGVTVRMKSL